MLLIFFKKIFSYRTIFGTIFLALLTLTAHAQYDFAPGAFRAPQSTTPVVIITTPENPKPNETVTFEVKTNSFDLKKSTIAWLENNQLVREGIGLTKHTITAGALGSETTITAVLKTTDGIILERSVTIRPASIDLIWETDTITPPFYKGKSLYSTLSEIKIAAIPNIRDQEGLSLNPKNLIYTWSLNNTVLGSLSGYGKRSVTLLDPIYRTPFTVSVIVTDETGTYSASGSIEIDTMQPLVLFYEDNPIYGLLLNKALEGDVRMVNKETSIAAVPYFFEANSRNDSNIRYQWSLNGNILQDSKSSSVTLRNENNISGRASLFLEVIHSAKLFQSRTKSLNVFFSNQ